MRRLLLPLLLAALFPSFLAGQKDPLAGFDQFVEQALKDWNAPGAAVAVVQGDKVILLKGYGSKDVERKLPVTPKSLFAIASITKSFTVTDLGMLIDEGKAGWDLPARTLFPGLKLYDPVLTEQI